MTQLHGIFAWDFSLLKVPKQPSAKGSAYCYILTMRYIEVIRVEGHIKMKQLCQANITSRF